MLLIFADETGTSYETMEDGLFKDGDFFLYGGIPISPFKYIELEKLFTMMSHNYFDIKSRFDGEIHAGEIFHRQGVFQKFKPEHIREYFSEVIQLLVKFDVPLLVGVSFKRVLSHPYKAVDAGRQLVTASNAISGFYVLCEHYLARKDTAGLIVADAFRDEEIGNRKLNFLSISDLTTKKGVRTDLLMRRLFYDIQKWRIDPSGQQKPLISYKYSYEQKAAFLIDNIHYIDSRHSPMNQFVDVMLFVFSRFLQKVRLSASSIYKGVEYEIPLDEASLGMLLRRCSFSVVHNGDFSMSSGESDFVSMTFSEVIKEFTKTECNSHNVTIDLMKILLP